MRLKEGPLDRSDHVIPSTCQTLSSKGLMKAITDINDPRLVKALAHPLRVQILGVLHDRTASPSDLAEELGAPLGNVSYHVRILAKLELLKLVRKRQRRGAIEHLYRANGRVRVSDRAWGQVPGIVKTAMVDATLEQVGRYVEQSAAMGGFERPESHLIRQPMRLDQQGWEELSAALGELVQRANEIEHESQQRLAEADHEGEIEAGLVTMLFEGAPGGAPVAAAHEVDGDRPTHSSPA
jgi:DNA-binding transcriptional ArsR family regulator